MKKFFSLVLAVIIIVVAVMPMAFATEFNHDAFIEASTKAQAYMYNLYASDETSKSRDKFLANFLYIANVVLAVQNAYPELKDIDNEPEKLKANPEAANALTAAYQEAIKYFEGQIADGTFVVQVDASELIIAMDLPVATYGVKKVENLIAKAPTDMTNRANEADVKYVEILVSEDTSGYTQAQFDSDVAFAIEYWNIVYDCLGGKHSIGNNNATNNNDGTHSYVCYFCTESATEEHSYIDGKCVCGEETLINNDGETEDNNNNKEENNNSEPENTNFIKRIIQKISDFFKNFFERLAEFFKR